MSHNEQVELTMPDLVPVIALVTKGDGLVSKKFALLRDKQADLPATNKRAALREAREEAERLADDDFKNKIVPRLMASEHPPAQCVFIKSKYDVPHHDIILLTSFSPL